MKILPVIDIKDGIVVRGVAGQRDSYRPVEGRLTAGHQVLDVAEAIRERFGLNEFYVADLDAILSDRPNRELYERLAGRGFRLSVDAGLRDVARAEDVLAAGADAVVAGLETSPGPEHLKELCTVFGPERVIFSLDLQDGRPLCAAPNWAGDALAMAEVAFRAGVRRMIVLDLSAVGVNAGVATGEVCRRIRERYPQAELLTGGGIRNVEDLRELQRAGIDGALVASALHSGSITPADLIPFTDFSSGSNQETPCRAN